MSNIGAIDRAEEEKAGKSVIAGLDRLLAEFDEFYRWMDKAHAGSLNEQGVDVGKRLRQVRLVVGLLNAALAESRAINQVADDAAEAVDGSGDPWAPLNARVEAMKPHLQRDIELMSLIELYSETFYWVAGRALKAATFLPGLKSLAAPGVRNVRNKLIEHTEGPDSRVFNGGFGYGKPRGPILAGLRTSETPDAWPDAGLFVNAEEFSTKFVAALKAGRGVS